MTRTAPLRPARQLLCDGKDSVRPIAEVIDEIASELNLLRYSHHNPEAFLERRDFLARRLRGLATILAGVAPEAANTTTYHAPAMTKGLLERPTRRVVREVLIRRS